MPQILPIIHHPPRIIRRVRWPMRIYMDAVQRHRAVHIRDHRAVTVHRIALRHLHRLPHRIHMHQAPLLSEMWTIH